MSTIEEARAQARDTLADYHRVNLKGYGAGNHASLARALRVLLDATEPPAHDESCEADWGPEGQESPCRCATPTDRPAEDEPHFHVWSELPCKPDACRVAEPTEDEREALATVLLDGRDADEGLSALRDRILAAGYRKGPRPVTDEMVEAAARASFEHLRTSRPADHGPYPSWEEEREDYRQYLRNMHRPALEAAEGARR